MEVTQKVSMTNYELRTLMLKYPYSIKNYLIASVSINSMGIQATLRNVAGTAANILLKNHEDGVNEGTVDLRVLYIE